MVFVNQLNLVSLALEVAPSARSCVVVSANKGVLLGTRLASEAKNVIVEHPLEEKGSKDKIRVAIQGVFYKVKVRNRQVFSDLQHWFRSSPSTETLQQANRFRAGMMPSYPAPNSTTR
jgi:hypothetical protein